jgi:mRNA-degrading endonuclease RelE of RelBE toxin-antitoxin system
LSFPFSVGAFVYQLGHGPLKAERRVRFPYALPREEKIEIKKVESRNRISGIEVGNFYVQLFVFCILISAFLISVFCFCFVVLQFQIIFNPISAAELAQMPRELQLYILGEFRGLPQEVLKSDLQHFGKLERTGKTLHRFRIGDYRVYFERHELGIVVHRILSRNTLKDFLFRSALPTGEDEALQENPKFWEMIEAARLASNSN